MNLTLFNKQNNNLSLFDELFESGFLNLPTTSRLASSYLPAANILEEESSTKIQLIMPGMSKKDIKISVDENILNVSYNQSSSNEEKSEKFSLREFKQSNFSRSFRLPNNSNNEKIESKMEDGILTINIPKIEKSPSKLIDIQ